MAPRPCWGGARAEDGHTYWGCFEVTLELYFYDVNWELYYDVYGYTNYETMEFEIHYYWISLYATYYAYMEEVLGYGEDSVTIPLNPDEQILAQRRLSDGSLADAVTEWTKTVDGYFEVTLTAPGFDILMQLGFTSTGAIIRTIPCPFPSLPCAVINGAKVLVTVVVSGAAILELWEIWRQRVPSPYGWPGDDGTVAPDPEWIWQPPESPPGSREGSWHKPSTGESLHPDLNNPVEGPHWDYKDPQGKRWRIWPDGTMTPRKS